MAENTPNQGNDEENDAPPLVVPSHDPLPPPPEISYTRPTLGKAAPLSEQNRLRTPSGPRGQSAPSSLNLGTGMSAGITLASSVVVGFLIGQWIDRHWHLAMPWGTIIFSLAGVTAGFLNLFRILGESDDHRKK